jgi:cytidylate kinase
MDANAEQKNHIAPMWFFCIFKHIHQHPNAMPYDLLTYFDHRFGKKPPPISKPGPFLTISRQTGCNGSGIAADLVKNLRTYNKEWKFINKEILEESANQLKMDPAQIRYVFETKKRTHADDVIAALSSRYYKSDKAVRKTITEVLRHYAKVGNVIMVGRAGVATTKDMPAGMHIRLIAPYEWRVNSLKRRKSFEDVDVVKFIKEHDLKKKKLIEDFCGKSIQEIEFDLTINCACFTRQQLIDLIIQAMKMKKLV